jgi:hypothetical protein
LFYKLIGKGLKRKQQQKAQTANLRSPLCKTDCESLEHALFKCPRVKEVWLHLGMEKII